MQVTQVAIVALLGTNQEGSGKRFSGVEENIFAWAGLKILKKRTKLLSKGGNGICLISTTKKRGQKMKVDIIAGGSSGNCIAIQNGGVTILVECGKPKTLIEKLLIQNGIDPTTIEAIFCTHPHQDHVQGIVFANRYRIPVYASEGTWKNEKYMQTVYEDLRNIATVGDEVNIENEFFVTPFRTHHNDFDPFGFVVNGDRGERLSICLDTGIVDQTMIEAMAGSDTYIIEANHDLDMLINGEYHEQLKARICSELGHLSNEQTAEALASLVVGKGERIILTHLSKSNNTPELAEKAVEDALEAKGFERILDYTLEVVR